METDTTGQLESLYRLHEVGLLTDEVPSSDRRPSTVTYEDDGSFEIEDVSSYLTRQGVALP